MLGFVDIRYMQVVRLFSLRTDHLCPQEIFLSRPRGHRATAMIMSMKNSSDAIGNRNRDPPDCSAVSEPTAPPWEPG
jgi:hypothetical protein